VDLLLRQAARVSPEVVDSATDLRSESQQLFIMKKLSVDLGWVFENENTYTASCTEQDSTRQVLLDF
jgi:hypothetical protein